MPLSAATTSLSLFPAKTLIPFDSPNSNILSVRHSQLFTSPLPPPPPPNSHRLARTAIFAAASTSRTASGVQQAQEEEQTSSAGSPISKWGDFASRVSGEWDGFGAEFTSAGKPIELPEAVVPEAFREWEVQVFDWQTQCPTLAETTKPILTYKLIKLLPTVGCEADAATRHSIEERIVGGIDNKVSAFAYDQGGSYFAVWNLTDRNSQRIVELEHCLVDPRDRETRVRVIQVLQLDTPPPQLQNIKVFSENWYGPFRNGEQLGGCAIRESGFASTGALEESEIIGIWQGTRIAASFQGVQADIICELVNDKPRKLIRDREGLITLPKQLWCSLKGKESGETWAEVGWLLGHGLAMTSSCTLSKDGSLKGIEIGQEAAVLEDV